MNESTPRQTAVPLLIVGTSGLISIFGLLLWPGYSGLVATFHLAAVVGWPPAQSLRGVISSRRIRLVLSVALSLAITALTFQLLSGFGYTEPALLVAVATGYSLMLGWLMPTSRASAGWRIETSI